MVKTRSKSFESEEQLIELDMMSQLLKPIIVNKSSRKKKDSFKTSSHQEDQIHFKSKKQYLSPDKRQGQQKLSSPSSHKFKFQQSRQPSKLTSQQKVKRRRLVKVAQKHQEQSQAVKKVVLKGKVPIDDQWQDHQNYHVLQLQKKCYSATLNQSNVDRNNNKFYIIQILQKDQNQDQNYLFTRWGRVGTKGQNLTFGPFETSFAIMEFQAKLYQKSVKGNYVVVPMDYGLDEEVENKLEIHYQKSKLRSQVKDLLKLIFDLKQMNGYMRQIGYDGQKMPLGKLSKQVIIQGYRLLDEMAQEIKNTNMKMKELRELSSQFYSIIPHNFGFKKMENYVIANMQTVNQKLQMLRSIQDIQIATKFLNQLKQNQNIYDVNYDKLMCEITPLGPGKHRQLIYESIKNTHCKTHNKYVLQPLQIYTVPFYYQLHKQLDNRFNTQLHNRKLLWHGSRITNYVGILSQGLRIAPKQAPVTGYMFGKGIYFADMVSKSANYCFTNRQKNIGLLLLCDVALGNSAQKTAADYYANELAEGRNSTKGVGKTSLNWWEELDGGEIAVGDQIGSQIQTELLYNQYIVYSLEQVRFRYLVKVRFNYD